MNYRRTEEKLERALVPSCVRNLCPWPFRINNKYYTLGVITQIFISILLDRGCWRHNTLKKCDISLDAALRNVLILRISPCSTHYLQSTILLVEHGQFQRQDAELILRCSTQPQTSSVTLFTPCDWLFVSLYKFGKKNCAPQESYTSRHNNLKSFQVFMWWRSCKRMVQIPGKCY